MSSKNSSSVLTDQIATNHACGDDNSLSGRPKLYEIELTGGIRLTLRLGDAINVPANSAFTQATGQDGHEEPQSAMSKVNPSELTSEAQTISHASTPIKRTTWTESKDVKPEQPLQEILQNLRAVQEGHKPFTTRRISSRPPPSSPPQYASVGSFSTPTIPALHQNSVPILIEYYRNERDSSPNRFDLETHLIHQSLLQAKIARGGEPPLLQNEYTAELASRLDAETVSKWTERRKEEEGEIAYLDIEGEDDDSTTTAHPSATTSFPSFPTHTNKPISSGSISHQTSETTKTTPEGNQIFTRRTVIEICEITELQPNNGNRNNSDRDNNNNNHEPPLTQDQNMNDLPTHNPSHHDGNPAAESRETRIEKKREMERSYIRTLDTMNKLLEDVSRVD